MHFSQWMHKITNSSQKNEFANIGEYILHTTMMAYMRVNTTHDDTYVNGMCDILHVDIATDTTKLETLNAELMRVEKNLMRWFDEKSAQELVQKLKVDIMNDMVNIKGFTTPVMQTREYVYIPIAEETEFPHVFMCKFI